MSGSIRVRSSLLSSLQHIPSASVHLAVDGKSSSDVPLMAHMFGFLFLVPLPSPNGRGTRLGFEVWGLSGDFGDFMFMFSNHHTALNSAEFKV